MDIVKHIAVPAFIGAAALMGAGPSGATQLQCEQFISSKYHLQRVDVEGNLYLSDGCRLGANPGAGFVEICQINLGKATLPGHAQMTQADIVTACQYAHAPA